ncbi:unnamed protein product [Adineta ricciae]|uniref:Uncharacterized protein n=2 Tax=Adineta ricciae TaxID=249248 RepID=A0A815NWV2_ADIRI|nr:unnamed protein product [Adineta ricciae]
MSSTVSELHRKRGNQFFAKVKQEENAAPVLRRGRLDDALKSYNQALATSTTNDEYASAYKNLAVLHAYHVNNPVKNLTTEKDVQYCQKECINSFGQAYTYGKKTHC